MIPFQTWLSQMVGYCQFVADTLGVRRAWVKGDYSRTSVTNFDELYEQFFDDLDSDALELELNTYMQNEPEARDVLTAFLQQIRVINAQRQHDPRLSSMVDLLDSKDWGRLIEIARCVTHRSPFPGLSKKEAGG